MRYDANQLSMLPENEFMEYYRRYVTYYQGLTDEQKRAENQYASIVKNEYTVRKQRAQQSTPLNFEVPESPSYSMPSPPPQPRKPKKNGGCLKVALIIIGIFLVLIIVIAALGSGVQSSGSSNSSGNISSSAINGSPAVQDENVPAEYRSALNKANAYSDNMHMSKAAIYDQLVSEYGEQFPDGSPSRKPHCIAKSGLTVRFFLVFGII